MTTPAPAPAYSLTLVQVTTIGPATYTLATAAYLAGVHPETLRYYCRLGLFGPPVSATDPEPVFDDDTLYELRRFEHYRRHHGVNRRTLRILCALWREIEQLQSELRFHRHR